MFFCSDVGERFEISLFVEHFELGAHLNVLSRDSGWGEGSGQLAFPSATFKQCPECQDIFKRSKSVSWKDITEFDLGTLVS